MKNLKKLSVILIIAVALTAMLGIITHAKTETNGNWTFSNYNESPAADQNTYYTINSDGSITVKDYAAYSNTTNSVNAVTKIMSNTSAPLNGFSASFEALGFNDAQPDVYPETLSLIMTNKPEAYTDAANYSTTRTGDAYYNDQYNMRKGFLYQDPLEGEYTLVVTLQDYCLENADGKIKHGTPGDGYYDCIKVCAYRNGADWGEICEEYPEIEMSEEIRLSFNVIDQDRILIFVNDTCPIYLDAKMGEISDYYFGMAAYSFGRANEAGYRGASFKLNKVALQKAAEFTEETAICHAGIITNDSGNFGDYVFWELKENGVLYLHTASSDVVTLPDYEWDLIESNIPFTECADEIKSVVIDAKLNRIGNGIFANLPNLENVYIKTGGYIESIGEGAFAGCTSLTDINLIDCKKLTTIGDNAFLDCSSLMYVETPASLTVIGGGAFYNTSALRVVKLNEGLETIGYGAFYQSALTLINIPSTVKSIGDYAFKYYANYSDAIPSLTIVFESLEASFYSNIIEWNTYASRPGITVICPKGSTGGSLSTSEIDLANVIGYGEAGEDIAWYLTSDGVLNLVGKGSTYHYLPNMGDTNDTYDGYKDAVKCIRIGDGITELGDSAFTGLNNASSVLFGENIDYLGYYLFGNNTNLRTVIIENDTCSSRYTFNGVRDNITIVCHKGSQAANVASDLSIACLYIEDLYKYGVTDDGLFWYIDNNGTLYIEGVGAMKDYDAYESPFFEYADDINTIDIGEEVTRIGSNAFSGINAKTLYIRDGIKEIGNGAFAYSTIDTIIWFNSKLETIGDGAFAMCEKLTKFDPPSSLKTIGARAFYGCTALNHVYLKSGLETIGNDAFASNKALTYIVIPVTVTKVGDRAFMCPTTNHFTAVIYGANTEFGNQVFDYNDFSGRLYLTVICRKDSVAADKFTSKCVYIENLATFGYIGYGDTPYDDTGIFWYLDKNGTLTFVGSGEMKPLKTEGYEYPEPEFRNDIYEYRNMVKQIVIREGITSIPDDMFGVLPNLKGVFIPDSVTYIGTGNFHSYIKIYVPHLNTSAANTYAKANNNELHVANAYSDGPVINISYLTTDVKDIFIAYGNYDSYRDVNTNKLVRLTQSKIKNATDYSYLVQNSGMYTVLVRHEDGCIDIHHIAVVIDKPTFTQDGLRLNIGNLDGVGNIKVIRTAYGTHYSVSAIKKAAGSRAFTAKYITDPDNYTIQYRENGTVTVAVCYENGYTLIMHFEIVKKSPTFVQNGNVVTFGNLNDVKVIRYAKGIYATSSEIKAAPGSVAINGKSLTSDTRDITLSKGTYTICVQYNDESYNYYTVTVE